MIITNIETFRYKLPLKRPLKLKDQTLHFREGFLIKLDNEHCDFGIGEISPLPGFHKENLNVVGSELDAMIPQLLQMEITHELSKLDGQFYSLLNDYKLSSSTQFGIELAILNLLAASADQSLNRIVGEPRSKIVSFNGLLSAKLEDLIDEAHLLRKLGYDSIKLKVGQQSIENDIMAVRGVREIVGSEINLRLDANQSWTLPEAIEFGKAIAEYEIEYIEEPIKKLSDFTRFYHETGNPTAMDESLLLGSIDDFEFIDGLKAIVLKPGMLGGIERAVKFCRKIESSSLYPVFSSAFESGVALSGITQLISVFSKPDIAAGLDTHRWFKEDLLETPFHAEQGRVDVESIAKNSQKVRWDLLTPVSKY
jgi:O-succinylbenzoate synthase